MSLNWLDILILVPLLAGLVRGLMRGFISEVIGLAVVILGVLGSRLFAPPFSAWLLKQFAWKSEVCDIVAYILVFLAIAIVLSILGSLLSKLLHAIHLGWVNRLLGGLAGILKLSLVILLAVYVMELSDRSFHWKSNSKVIQTSKIYPYCVQALNYIDHHH